MRGSSRARPSPGLGFGNRHHGLAALQSGIVQPAEGLVQRQGRNQSDLRVGQAVASCLTDPDQAPSIAWVWSTQQRNRDSELQ